MASAASGASGFLLGDDAAEFMRERGEQTWEAANEAGGGTACWTDACAECGDDGGLRACCGYCNLVFHPACLDPPQVVENWDEVAFACGLCVADAVAKPSSTTQNARLKREARQRRATTAAAEARRAARDDDIRREHGALYVAKYATKAKPADYTTGCAPPAAGAAALEAAAASGGGRWRFFTMDKESPFAAHAAPAGAVAAPLGAPGNKRVECDGGLYVRWDYAAKYVTKPVAPAAPCNTATPAACEDGDDMPALVSASDSDSE